MKQKYRIGERNDLCRETKASYFREVLSILKTYFLWTSKCSVTSTPEPGVIQDIWHVQQLIPGVFSIPTTFVGLTLAEHMCTNTSNSLGQSRWHGRLGSRREEGLVWLLAAPAEPRGRNGAVWSPPWAFWGHKGLSVLAMREGRKPSWNLAVTALSRPLSLTSLSLIDGLPWPMGLWTALALPGFCHYELLWTSWKLLENTKRRGKRRYGNTLPYHVLQWKGKLPTWEDT